MLSTVELAAEISAADANTSSPRAASGRAGQEDGRVLFIDHWDAPKPSDGLSSFDGLAGRSAAMQDLYRLLERAAVLDITVLLTGETGAGKELAARAIHCHSARKERRFVPVNCGALPSELIERA